MRVTVYGVGAVGGWIAARLARSGMFVNVVARGKTLEVLKAKGLTLCSPQDEFTVSVNADSDPRKFGVQDCIVLAVKAPALRDVAQELAPLLGPDTTVVTAMNGVPWWFFHQLGGSLADRRLASVDPDGAIAQAIPSSHILGCVVHATCSAPAPATVRYFGGDGLIIGEPSGVLSDRVRCVAYLLNQAGIKTEVSEAIRSDAWYKLWGNLCINPISALTGATVDRIMADPALSDVVTRMMLEAQSIGICLGIPMHQSIEERQELLKTIGVFKSSMLQDMEAGRMIELDALVGAVSELGHLVGVPTPSIDTVLSLTRMAAQTRGLY